MPVQKKRKNGRRLGSSSARRTALKYAIFLIFMTTLYLLYVALSSHMSPPLLSSTEHTQTTLPPSSSEPEHQPQKLLAARTVTALRSKTTTPTPTPTPTPTFTTVRFNLNNVNGEINKKGSFVLKVHPDWSPIGAKRFVELVRADFFTSVRFFRVIQNFMAQFGISGDPAVAAKFKHQILKDDPVLASVSNNRGYISFATSGPNSRTTQMFINFQNNPRLDAMGFTPFAKVIQGMDVVDEIYKIGERPSQHRIQQEGNAYLEKDFPRLTYIVNVEIVGGEKNDNNSDNNDNDNSKATTIPTETTLPETLVSVLRSEGCPAKSDVRGNLGPASVITSPIKTDWLKNRWQAALDMSGKPIPGQHWVAIDLQQVVVVDRIVIDWETAYCEDYILECRTDEHMDWTPLDPYKTASNTYARAEKQHIVQSITFDPKNEENREEQMKCQHIRLLMNKPATAWGVSIWELQVWGPSNSKGARENENVC